MEEKVIPYGTRMGCVVAEVSPSLIVVTGDNNEGFLLMRHEVEKLPKPGDVGVITFKKIDRWPYGYWHYEPCYACPFDKSFLYNVGPLKEFEDGKDNHVCPECHRIWVDVGQEEWWTRQARVQIVGELKEGVNYTDVVKVIV